MGATLFKSDILFLQRFLTCGGFDPKGMDGTWGPHTQRAVEKFEAASAALRASLGSSTIAPSSTSSDCTCPCSARRVGAPRPPRRRLLGEDPVGHPDVRRTERALRARAHQAGEHRHQGPRRSEQSQFRSRLGHRPLVAGYYDGKKKPADRALERRAAARYVEASQVVGDSGSPGSNGEGAGPDSPIRPTTRSTSGSPCWSSASI